MENRIVTQFEIWDVKVPEYVKVRINNGEKPLIDFCNDVIKKFEELTSEPIKQEIAKFHRDMRLIAENSRYGAFSKNSSAKEVPHEKEESV